MHLKRVLWLTLLLPQFALLPLFVYSDLRELRYELKFHHPQMMTQCSPYPPFSPATFGCEMAGVSATIGLCGRRRPGRWLYAVFALWVLALTLPDFIRSSTVDSFLLTLYAVVAGTLALCFVWSFPVPPAPPPLQPAS